MRMISTLRVDLGSDTIAAVSSASSLAVHIGAPVIALSRKLLDAGLDPATPLEAYRRDKLCLTVRSIGEAAQLYVAATSIGRPVFRRERDCAPASLVSHSE